MLESPIITSRLLLPMEMPMVRFGECCEMLLCDNKG